MKTLKSFNLEKLVNSFKNVSKKAVDLSKGISVYIPNPRTVGIAALWAAYIGISALSANAGTWSDDFSDGTIGSR